MSVQSASSVFSTITFDNMIVLKHLPFVDIFTSVADFFELATKASLKSHCDELGVYLPSSLRKADFAYSLAKFFENDPQYTYNQLSESEKEMLDKLLTLPPEEFIIFPRNDDSFLKMQKLHLVVTYETRDNWHIYMPECIRMALAGIVHKDKDAEIQNMRHMMKSIPDFPGIISKYSIRSQAVIHLVLDSVNMMTFGSLPLSSKASYHSHIDRLTGNVLLKRSDHELQSIVRLLNKDLQSTLDKLTGTFETFRNSSAHAIESNLDLMGYGTLLHALYEILTRMSKKSKEETEAMLYQVEFIDETPSFTSIEEMAVKVMSEILGNMSRFVNDD